MNVVIVGGGKVGRKLVEDFTAEGDDVVLIDTKAALCENIQDVYDVRCVNGSGADISVLEEAETGRADLLVAVTTNDELNMLCTVMAKKMGAQRCAARVRNREYFNQLDFIRDALGISFIVNPEYTTASEISRMLRFPAAVSTETFAKGRIELIEFQVKEGSILENKSLLEIYEALKIKVLICAVQRGDEVSIPKGDFVLQAGDRIHITASHKDLARFVRETGVMNRKIKNVMIIGGGKISFYLAKQLLESGMTVKIIEQSRNKCIALSEALPNCDVVCGDGTDRQVLEEEGINKMDSVVALTGIDEENMIISMYANKLGIDKIVTKINRVSFADLMGVSSRYSIVAPQKFTADMILSYARAMKSAKDTEMKTMYRIVNEQAEAMEFVVNQDSPLTRNPLKDLGLKDNALIAAVVRGNRMFIPDGQSHIEKGDTVIVVSTGRVGTLTDILA